MVSLRNSAISPPSQLRQRQTPWEPKTTHANGHPDDADQDSDTDESEAQLYSRARIFFYTTGIAVTFTASLIFTLILAFHYRKTAWRLTFFLTALSWFHDSEYLVYALYNPRAADTNAFLLNNGRAYNIAHGLAFLECLLHLTLFPQMEWPMQHWLLSLGFALIIVGQIVRTTAMATAGPNFNHYVQSEKKSDHVLVTSGIYGYLRHPAYFGFYWWGLGTQIVLGNIFCLIGYAFVLWRFFRKRIEKEEELLVNFFGDDYVRYRERTRIGIPLMGRHKP